MILEADIKLRRENTSLRYPGLADLWESINLEWIICCEVTAAIYTAIALVTLHFSLVETLIEAIFPVQGCLVEPFCCCSIFNLALLRPAFYLLCLISLAGDLEDHLNLQPDLLVQAVRAPRRLLTISNSANFDIFKFQPTGFGMMTMGNATRRDK